LWSARRMILARTTGLPRLSSCADPDRNLERSEDARRRRVPSARQQNDPYQRQVMRLLPSALPTSLSLRRDWLGRCVSSVGRTLRRRTALRDGA
jgi:hypothetical protein